MLRRVPLRVLFDTNAIDTLALGDPALFDTLRRAVEDGRLECLWTHVTSDEICRIPDEAERSRRIVLVASLARLVPTGAFVVGYSRVDFARLAEDPEAVEAFRLGNLKHTEDALLAATAEVEGAVLVTADRRLRARCEARGVPVLYVEDVAAAVTERG